jgi:sugar phosphate isomerase/epimerase
METIKFAFSKSTGSLEEAEYIFTHFREVGYEGLQLKANQYMPYVDAPERFVEAWGGYLGVASGLITAGDLGAESLARLRHLFAFGQTVGTELIIFCHSVPRVGLTIGDIQTFARDLSEIGKEARDYGLKLSLHHHHNQPVMHREDFDIFFEVAEYNALGLTVDTAHLIKSGVHNIAGLIRDLGHVIDNFHLKDFARGAFKVLGTGAIDFAPVFAAIRDIGYRGWISADEESGAEAQGALRQCLDFMKDGLGIP